MRNYLLASELPTAISDRSFLSVTRPMALFISGWNRYPHARSEMAAERPDCDRETLASIGAIVHALCIRDGITTPVWAASSKASSPILINGETAEDDYGKCVRLEAPAVCAQHNVFFESEMLNKGITNAEEKET